MAVLGVQREGGPLGKWGERMDEEARRGRQMTGGKLGMCVSQRRGGVLETGRGRKNATKVAKNLSAEHENLRRGPLRNTGKMAAAMLSATPSLSVWLLPLTASQAVCTDN